MADNETSQEIKPSKPNYYFNNELVESLLDRYVARGCVDVELRDQIMSHAGELIRQIIRVHNFEYITPNRDEASFNELFQVAWMQIEKTLYKYDTTPGSSKLFNMWCVAPDTLLFSSNGIVEIANVDSSYMVNGGEGLNKVSNKIERQNVETLLIQTECGYEIECTPEHYLLQLTENDRGWTKAEDLDIDDLIGIQYNQRIYGNQDSVEDIELVKGGDWSVDVIDEELSYVIGLFIAEGSYSYNKLVVYNTDQDVIDALVNNNLHLNFIHEPEYQRISLCNARFIELLIKLGFGDRTNAMDKHMPQRLLKMSEANIHSMLRGMFDGDGHSRIMDGCVGFTSISKKLIDQTRMLLLNEGIISKLALDDREPGEYQNKNDPWQINLSSKDSAIFYERIGFNINRKMDNRKNLRQAKDLRYGLGWCFYGSNARRSLKNNNSLLKRSDVRVIKEEFLNATIKNPKRNEFLLRRMNELTAHTNNVIWLPIKSIEKSRNDVCEIEVDSESHSYISNGFISHNSQIAKTRILAFIKKEKRDKKNVNSYKDFVNRQHKIRDGKDTDIEKWIAEAKEMCFYNTDYIAIIDAIKYLWINDNKPHDGFITKLENISGKSRNTINTFLKTVRFRRDEFSTALVIVKDIREYDPSDQDGYFYSDQDA